MIADKLRRSFLSWLISSDLSSERNWTRTNLGKIATLKSGRDLTKSQYQDEKTKSSIPYITGASNFLPDQSLLINRYTEHPVVIAAPGDVLITVKGTIGNLAFAQEECHIARQVMAVQSDWLVPEYLALILEAAVDDLKASAKSMIPGISRRNLLDLELSLPPEQDQKTLASHASRLFSHLDHLAELEREREHLDKQLPAQLTGALMLLVKDSLFDFMSAPAATSTIGDLFSLKAGKFIKASEIHDRGEYPVYGGNGIRGYTSTYNHDGVYPLISRQGALCGNLQLASSRFYATEHAVAVSCKEDTNIKWAYYMLKALNLNQYSTATAQPGLAVKKLLPLPVTRPEMSDQEKIAEFCDSYVQIIDVLESL